MNCLGSIRDSEDTSRISITAHHTAYTWVANGLSHPALATWPGKFFYYNSKPWMFVGRTLFGLSDLETALLQRHLILDHLLEQALRDSGVTQVLELACGLSPRGYRFKRGPGHDGVVYVEADLPDMARHKETLLKRASLLRPGHTVASCNILTQKGKLSLENLARQHLDPSRPTAVITEGIINYFDPGTIQDLWSRIANLLKSFSGGVYLSDNMPHPTGHPLGVFLKSWNQVVRLVSRGGFYMHFRSDPEAEDALKAAGFSKAASHNPGAFQGDLNLPVSRQPSFVRVLEAWI